eukprot:Nk52_evm11s210 gene=Nk52_evmTU11s210
MMSSSSSFEELKKVDSRFKDFESIFFPASTTTTDRLQYDQAKNKQLDVAIEQFLCLLSPHLYLKPSQRVIEHLVRRFRINEFNIDALLACAFPYHGTKVFHLVVQTIKLDTLKKSPRWFFLAGLVNSNSGNKTLDRGVIVQRCVEDLSLFKFFMDMIPNALKRVGVCHKSLVSFYTALVMSAIERKQESIDDAFMYFLLPYVVKGIKSGVEEYQTASYLILCQLAVACPLDVQFVDEMIVLLRQFDNSAECIQLLMDVYHENNKRNSDDTEEDEETETCGEEEEEEKVEKEPKVTLRSLMTSGDLEQLFEMACSEFEKVSCKEEMNLVQNAFQFLVLKDYEKYRIFELVMGSRTVYKKTITAVFTSTNPMEFLVRLLVEAKTNQTVVNGLMALKVYVQAGGQCSDSILAILVSFLGWDCMSIREAAMACLAQGISATSGNNKSPLTGDNKGLLVQCLVSAKEEIIMDKAVVSRVITTSCFGLKSKSAVENFRLFFLEQTFTLFASSKQHQLCILQMLSKRSDKRLLLAAVPHMIENKSDRELLQALMRFVGANSVGALKDAECWKIFFNCLNDPNVQNVVIGRIDGRLFADTSVKNQKAIFGSLLDILLQNNEASTTEMARRVLNDISVTDEIVCNELSKYMNSTAGSNSKRQRVEQEDSSSWQKMYTVLEFLLFYKKTSHCTSKLFATLFDVLRQIFDYELSIKEDDEGKQLSSVEYVKQLCLSAILSVLQNAEDHVKEAGVNVEIVVQCVRISENPQTHNNALSLLGEIAKSFPQRVLHNIMPIFTFMGASAVRQDDNYTFSVIEKTISIVLPALINDDSNKNNLSEITGVMQIFVDAFVHIPQHRRVRLFKHICEQLGVERHLFSMITLLLNKQALEKANGASNNTVAGVSSGSVNGSEVSDSNEYSSFCLELMAEFSLCKVTSALVNLLDFLQALPFDLSASNDFKFQSLYSLKKHTAKQMRLLKYIAMGFLASCFSSKGFLVRVAKCKNSKSRAEYAEFQATLLRVVEGILVFITGTNRYEANVERQTGAHKFIKGVLAKSYTALDKVNILLSVEGFVKVAEELIKHPDPSVRRKALLLFNTKAVQLKDESISLDEEILFVGMVDRLLNIIENNNEDVAINRQAALLSVEILSRHFAAKYPSKFTGCLKIIVGPGALGHKNPHVVASSVACLAALCAELTTRTIGFMNQYMPSLIEILSSSFRSEHNRSSTKLLLQLGCISALEVIVKHMSKFLSPYLKSIIVVLCDSWFCVEQDIQFDSVGDKAQFKQILSKAESVRREMAASVSARTLLPALSETYTSIRGASSLEAYFEMTGIMCAGLKKEEVAQYHKFIFKFFLDCFDVRTSSAYLKDDLGNVEMAMIEAFTKLVLRLPESLFKPLLLKLHQWSNEKSNDLVLFDRYITFYQLVKYLSSKLKNLFEPFFHHFIGDMSRVLNLINSEDQIERHFSYGDTMLCAKDKKADMLMRVVLDCLKNLFTFDQGSLREDKSKFDVLLQPLVNVISNNRIGSADVYQERVAEFVVPTMAQFARAAGSDALWKPLNHEVLMKTRDESAMVRFAALKVVEEFYSSLGEEFLILLPETIPFLAELMEDDSLEVEQLVQEVIKVIEGHLGESLQKYF